jgi:hypothetical protein
LDPENSIIKYRPWNLYPTVVCFSHSTGYALSPYSMDLRTRPQSSILRSSPHDENSIVEVSVPVSVRSMIRLRWLGHMPAVVLNYKLIIRHSSSLSITRKDNNIFLNFLCRIWLYVHTLTYMILSSSFATEMKKSAGDQVVISSCSSWWPDVGGFLQIILYWTNQTLPICNLQGYLLKECIRTKEPRIWKYHVTLKLCVHELDWRVPDEVINWRCPCRNVQSVRRNSTAYGPPPQGAIQKHESAI